MYNISQIIILRKNSLEIFFPDFVLIPEKLAFDFNFITLASAVSQASMDLFSDIHNSHMFLDFDQREGSVLSSNLETCGRQSHAQPSVPL